MNIRFEQYLGNLKHIHKCTAVYEAEAVSAPLAFLNLEIAYRVRAMVTMEITALQRWGLGFILGFSPGTLGLINTELMSLNFRVRFLFEMVCWLNGYM